MRIGRLALTAETPEEEAQLKNDILPRARLNSMTACGALVHSAA